MINEERVCAACHVPLGEMQNAVMVPDAGGANLVYHRACLEQMVGEVPTPDEPRASVRMLPSRPRRESDFIRIKPLVRAADGSMVHPDGPMSKAETKQPTCILCNKQASEEDQHTIWGVPVHAHGVCISALKRSLEGEDVRQVPATRVPVDVNPALKSHGGLTADEERMGKRDAVFLVSTLASMLREQGY